MTTTLITGTNRGIGLELARQLKARGHRVIAVCRKSSKELDALGVQVETGIDIGRDESVEALRARVGTTPIDWVIANAGVLQVESLDDLALDRMRLQLEVNALGPLRTIKAVQGQIQRGGKVALITSRMGSIGDNGSGGYYGYRMSKAALNAAGVSLAHDLKSREIGVAILHPGFVRTDMTGGHGGIDPKDSAAQLIARIDALSVKNSGTFWHANGEVLPW